MTSLVLLLALAAQPTPAPAEDGAVDVVIAVGASVAGCAVGAVVGVGSSFLIFPPFVLLPEPLGQQALIAAAGAVGGAVAGTTAGLIVWAVDDAAGRPLLVGLATSVAAAFGAVGGGILWSVLLAPRASDADPEGAIRVLMASPIIAGTVAATITTGVVVAVTLE